jgi:hypothetical protein
MFEVPEGSCIPRGKIIIIIIITTIIIIPTPAVAKTIIELPANVRASGLEAAFRIEEEEER